METHCVEPMVQQYYLGILAISCLHQHIAWMGVAVYVSIYENHLRIKTTNLLRDIMGVDAIGQHVGAVIHLPTLAELHGQYSLCGERPLHLWDLGQR